MSSNRHELVRQVGPALRPYLQTYWDRWSVAGLHAGTDLASSRSAAGSRAIVAARRAALRRWAAWSPAHALDPNPSRAIANGVLKAESGLPDSG
jgi:hypothetical protein